MQCYSVERCGIPTLSKTQYIGSAQPDPAYIGLIYLYRLSFLSGRGQQTFDRDYTLQ